VHYECVVGNEWTAAQGKPRCSGIESGVRLTSVVVDQLKLEGDVLLSDSRACSQVRVFWKNVLEQIDGRSCRI
jgi:hypothetical protein